MLPQLAEPRAPITCVDDAGGSGGKPCAEPERKLILVLEARAHRRKWRSAIAELVGDARRSRAGRKARTHAFGGSFPSFVKHFSSETVVAKRQKAEGTGAPSHPQ